MAHSPGPLAPLHEPAALLRAWLDRRGPGRVLQPTWRRIAAALGLVEGAFLQVNAGSAWLALHVASGHPELDVVAIDPDRGVLAVAERHRGTRLNVTLREMDAAHIVYPDCTFHAAAAVGALGAWSRPPAVLAEVHRVLRPGGRFLLYEADRELQALPEGWLDLGGLPWSLFRPALRRWGCAPDAWAALKDDVRSSPFGGGEESRHGPFLRLVLTRREGRAP